MDPLELHGREDKFKKALNMAKFTVTAEIAQEVQEKMSYDLALYEQGHGINVGYKPFSIILSDDHEEAMGVLKAYTAFAEIYIEDLWVDSKHRRKGYGKALIQELEKIFEGKGFNNINLCTSDFQAPAFYEKCGFELEFIRKNPYNPKLTKFFFCKFFKNETQTQGLL